MQNLHGRLLRSAVAVMTLAAAAAGATPAWSSEVVMFTGRVPEVAELASALWPKPPAAAGRIATRGLLTRSIRLQDEPAAPAAVEPAAYAQATAAGGTEVISGPAGTSAADTVSSRPSGFGFNIQFAFDSAEVLPESRPYLDQVGELLLSPQAQGQSVRILGHTDALGPMAYNDSLSERRAVAVRSYLMLRHGIPGDRLQVAWLGERQPLPGRAPHDPVNRRVEFHAAP